MYNKHFLAAAVFILTSGLFHQALSQTQQNLLEAYHDGHGFSLRKGLVDQAKKEAQRSSGSSIMSQNEGVYF